MGINSLMVPGVNFRDHETPTDKALQKKKIICLVNAKRKITNKPKLVSTFIYNSVYNS